MDQENQVKQVTKVKHPGRVESGKKLAAWNKQNKAKLKQQPEQVPAEEPKQEPVQELHTTSSQEPASHSSAVTHVLMFFAGIGAFLALAYVLINRAKESKQNEVKPESKKSAVFDPSNIDQMFAFHL